MQDSERNVRISRKFSKILRHSACDFASLLMQPDGYVSVRQLLSLPVFSRENIDVEFVKRMVAEDSKRRFTLKEHESELLIRANQGHSGRVAENLDFENLLVPIFDSEEIPVAIHGTSLAAWERIKCEGIHRRGRSHIHMSPGIVGVDAGVRSGMRNSSTVYIYIDTAKAMSKGIKFFRSTNGVILSDGIDGGYIPIDCFMKVVDVRSNEILS